MKNVIFLICLLLIACSSPDKFRLIDPSDSGIDFSNTISESDTFNLMRFEYIYNGAGVGIADLNGDGLQDIIFAGNQVSSKVYLNLGKFRFRDITYCFKGLSNDQWYSSVTIADVNNDRVPDIYLTSTRYKEPERRKNRLWVSDGKSPDGLPHYTEKAEEYGVADTSFSVCAAFLDYDLDGDADLYILNNTVNSRMNTSYREKITDGSASNNDRLYRNNGDGSFTDVTIEAGILYEGFGLGLAVGDINKDGYPDIYVSNDFISNDLLYINLGNGTFRNDIGYYLSYQSRSSMGNDMADINNDGYTDIYTTDMLPQQYHKLKQSINGYSYIYYINDEKYGFEHQYIRNMLHLHNGFLNGRMLPLSEIGQKLGIAATDWSWSPLFADYDNDGDKDLIVSNGFPRDETDKDWTRLKVIAEGTYASDEVLISMAPAIKVPNLAFENVNCTDFRKRTDWLPDIPSFSYGAAFADLDNDGDLDYVINNLNDSAFILQNTTMEHSDGGSNFIEIKLEGSDRNTMAVGAKTEIWTGGKYQYSENFLSRGYASSVSPVLHFGTGQYKTIDSMRITWPAPGGVTFLKDIPCNKIISLSAGDAQISDKELDAKKIIPTLFTQTDSILQYEHQQRDFIDYVLNQKTIPHKYSQIGPRISSGDIDNDGVTDLIAGSTNEKPTCVFLRKGKEFINSNIKGLTGNRPFSEADFSVIDVDKDGDNDVIAVAGGYESLQESTYEHFVYLNTGQSFMRMKLPVPSFPASVVRTCDFNKDGWPDIFIGARIKKGMFPYSNHSWLILNENGSLKTDSASKLNLGMVTDAVWTDYDNDGWTDLLVTREWNSIAVLKNVQGKYLQQQLIPEIEKMQGMWFSIAAGDFDNDGDDDYIAGNLGLNNRFSASEKYPMNLYVIDFDLDGNLDPFVTAFFPDQSGIMKEYPINYLDELWSQSPYFSLKFTTYASFGIATVDDILGNNMRKRIDFSLEVNTTTSGIIWNDGDRFRWEALPSELQVSPVKKILVEDINKDSLPDIILGGNDHSFELATGYYDALKGVVMLNNNIVTPHGSERFTFLAPSESGLLLHGMVESLIFINEGDSPILIAGFNRSKAKVFKLNIK